jgi:mannose-6-phosphate isomerase-like protein (cupin superfamily)
MEVRSREEAEAFITLDGSTIRVLLDAQAGARNQSLAEATLEPGRETIRHRHPRSEEIYFFLAGGGAMEIEGDIREVAAGDAVLIPSGARHQITAGPEGARFLCSCAPPYTDDDTLFD